MKLKIFLQISIIICILISLFFLLKKPSNERVWTDDAKVLPTFTISSSTVEVKNIRDWRYAKGEVMSKEFYSEIFDGEKIKQVYFLINPFGKWEGVGHTFFLFEFEDEKTISVSVEARREEGEDYSAIKGLFNNYELWYTWGSAADLFSRRAVYHNEDLYMYPLLISKDTMKRLFIDIAQASNKIKSEPQFYNTISSNCTNTLADSANRVNPGSIPWNFARIFTGYSDNVLYKLKLIPHDKSFEETFANSRIDEVIKKIPSNYTKEEFWDNLKSQLK